ncbi:hypothetical protein FACS189454_00010 [Planctomycetales bacterium]|nr:hypothetical protein FACS189454_00010 [Planctomycetales bacterium]
MQKISYKTTCDLLTLEHLADQSRRDSNLAEPALAEYRNLIDRFPEDGFEIELRFLPNYLPYLKKHGLYLSQILVWNKLHPVLTRKDFMGAHEMCFYCWKEGAGHQFFGPGNITDLWEVKKIPPQSMIHLTEKPVELVVRAIQYSSKSGENVLEIFGGSGSTLIACEQTGRRCLTMEIDPLYCDVIVKRWEDFTGKKGVRHRATDGRVGRQQFIDDSFQILLAAV